MIDDGRRLRRELQLQTFHFYHLFVSLGCSIKELNNMLLLHLGKETCNTVRGAL